MARRVVWATAALSVAVSAACGLPGFGSSLDAHGVLANRCGALLRGLDRVPISSRLLLLGELHGTQETPAAIGAIVCQLARRDVPLVLGIEMPTTEQAQLDRFVASPDSDRAALLGSPFWQRRDQDGRSSVAMLGLVEQVRALRASGADVRVVAFDIPLERYDDAAVDRDAEMAKTILSAHAATSPATMIVLTGNLHAMTSPDENGFRPMGAYLRETVPNLVSLNAENAGGQAWICTAEPRGCGARDVGGVDRGPSAFVELVGARSDEGFDGLLYVGRVTAAAPAVTRGP